MSVSAFESELASLSARCKLHIRAGQIHLYSETLKEIAVLFLREERYRDQIRMQMLSFYIDLSGFSRAAHIDRTMIELLRNTVLDCELSVKELEQLYFELISPEVMTQHVMTVKDSWYLLCLCLNGKIEQAEQALLRL